MNGKNNIISVGMVWYTKGEWQKMKPIASDTEKLENTFKEWEEMADKSIRDMKRSGIVVKKVFIKTDEFITWCKIHSLPFNASSRSRYITEIMSKLDSN